MEFWRRKHMAAVVKAVRTEQGNRTIPLGKALIDYENALAQLTEDQRLRATVYAMNTLLLAKNVYTTKEFRFQFRQSAQKQLRKKKRKRGLRRRQK
jgi:hypothetical protein